MTGCPATLARTTADAIVQALAAAGTRVMFGVPGGGPNLDVIGAAAAAGLRFVLTHGETAATIMAASYADLTGAPGAVVVTRGPGLASAVNGVAHAALDRLPVVVIADTVAAAEAGRVSHQRLDQLALGRSVAKAALTFGGRGAGEAARQLVELALAVPCGPVVAIMDDTDPSPVPVPEGAGGVAVTGDLTPLAEALRLARRPVVMLGTGAIGRTDAIRAALAGCGIPALHTYRARGVIPDSAPEAAGLVTGGTMEWPLLSAADLIIGLGVDEAEMIPAGWDYRAPVILVTEPASAAAAGLESYFTGATTLAAPLTMAAEMLAANSQPAGWLPAAGRAARTDAARRLTALAGGMSGRLAARRPAPEGLAPQNLAPQNLAPQKLAPQQVAASVRAHTPPETIATVDAGAHMLAVMPLWEVPEPHRLLISNGLATMGYAVPAAIAAALAAPGAPVLAFTGDGGLGMTLAELETAVRLGLAVIVVVFNDAALSLIKIKQRPGGQGGSEAVDYLPVSFAAAATAMGAAGECVMTEPGLDAALAAALRRDGPTVIDVQVDPGAYPAIMELTRGEAGRRHVPGLVAEPACAVERADEMGHSDGRT